MATRAAEDIEAHWAGLGQLFGRVEPRPAARCGNVRCEPGWNWRVELTDFDLWLATAGRGRFELNGEIHPIRPGSLFWLRPGDEGLATQEAAYPLSVVYVHFDFFGLGGHARAEIEAGLLPDRAIPLPDHALVKLLLSRVVLLQQAPAALGEIEARLLLHQAILEAYRRAATNRGALRVAPDPRVAHVLTRLHGRPAERLPLGEAAALVGLSPDHFSRMFTAQTGVPYRRYVIQARLDRAYQLLEETTLGVGEVAAALGYDELFLFSRQFKARFGVPPSRVRGGRFRVGVEA